MKAGIFAKTYPLGSPAAIFNAATCDGFSTVQFNLSCIGLDPLPAELPIDDIADLKTVAADAKIEFAALSGTYNMAHPDGHIRAAARLGFANVVNAAALMGAPIVTLCTGSRNPLDMWSAHPDNNSPQAWHDMRQELDFAIELAQRHGLLLGIEPEPGNIVCDVAASIRLIAELGNGAPVGFVLDCANLVSGRLTDQRRVVDEAVDRLGGHTILAHAKDIHADGTVACPGEGAVDLPNFISRLHDIGYDGALIAHGFPASDATRAGAYLSSLIRTVAR